jgi:hypothetical protein
MLTEAQLRIGRIFEAEFERQAHKRGLFCIRHCDQQGANGVKAPLATGPYAGYRLPDFSVMKDGKTYWVEVKYKTERTFTHSLGIYETGIDLPNWRDSSSARRTRAGTSASRAACATALQVEHSGMHTRLDVTGWHSPPSSWEARRRVFFEAERITARLRREN